MEMKTVADTHYSPRLLLILTLIIGLNILDSLFTIMILDLGGQEVNPVVRSAIHIYGNRFWIWKYALVSVSAVLLCHCSRLKHLKGVIFVLACFYLAVVVYQIALLNFY